jgi:protein-disulfide isomerase
MRFLMLFVPAVLMVATATAADVKNFKESGSATAPVTVEVYTDFQCPHCREFYMAVLPSLTTEFINTGKVRLIHRDFRLPQFQYSKTAARYANASGEVGKYDVVANQLFLTQPDWAQNGNVDGAVAKVLTPAELEKVRAMVKDDAHLDDASVKDEAMAMNVDHIQATPTVVIVYKGKREAISGGVSFPLLKSYINGKLAE